MEAAKQAISSHLSKSGKHDTSVHQTTAPAVTNERVDQHHHENVTTAIDREVHQDHYHTTVQPVNDKHVRNETHHHNVAAVEHRKAEHGNDEEVQRRLQAEQAKYKDTTVRGEEKHTASTHPTLEGEHVHHHVHENIQPVVNRQTIEPHVHHTVVPIHETHHSSAKHHATTALPAVSMADFKNQGGALTGQKEKHDFFQGEPKGVHGHEPHTGRSSDEFRRTGHVDQHGSHTGSSHTGTGAAGVAGAAAAATGAGHHNSTTTGTHNSSAGLTDGTHHSGTHHSNTTTGNGLTGTGTHNSGKYTGTDGVLGSGNSHTATGNTVHTGNTSHSGTTGLTGTKDHSVTDTDHTTKKPSLLSRLNPLKDADGDGKKGFMD